MESHTCMAIIVERSSVYNSGHDFLGCAAQLERTMLPAQEIVAMGLHTDTIGW